ncbi:hypothetical protein lbkm_0906 [Lachnospiraceae bacterium KM106-2]|nr:hypothetical protein lbkm_0906 [Lachnospiraceae bacterium KM106-2]
MKKQVLIRVLTTVVSISIFVCVITTVLFRNYVSKTNNFVKFEGKGKQTIYILGTFHNSHFDKKYRYSLADIRNCITNLKPDVVYLESREETYQKYGCMDGPIDTLFAYSLCKEQNIPVRCIDYWKMDNNFDKNQGTTNSQRDDKMYENITTNLVKDKDKKILIVCGASHRTEQMNRLSNDHYKEILSFNKSEIFQGSKTFTYPKTMEQTIKDKITYLKEDQTKIIAKQITDPDVAKFAKKNNEELVDSLQSTLDQYVLKERLY